MAVTLSFLLTIVVQSKYIGGFHSTTLLWAEGALEHEASLQAIDMTVVADPVFFWDLLYPVATLVDRDVAQAAKNNHVFVLIVAVVTYNALCVLLGSDSSGVCCRYCHLVTFLEVFGVLVGII